jgi:hypothetical protein
VGGYWPVADAQIEKIGWFGRLLPAYSVEKLVCKMSDFVARVSMRGLRSG